MPLSSLYSLCKGLCSRETDTDFCPERAVSHMLGLFQGSPNDEHIRKRCTLCLCFGNIHLAAHLSCGHLSHHCTSCPFCSFIKVTDTQHLLCASCQRTSWKGKGRHEKVEGRKMIRSCTILAISCKIVHLIHSENPSEWVVSS